jgi:hypothetical protein
LSTDAFCDPFPDKASSSRGTKAGPVKGRERMAAAM